MTPDPKWLEILKDADIQLGGAAACGLFLLAARWGWFPLPADWMVQLAWIGLLIFGCLFGVQLLKVFFAALELLVLWLETADDNATGAYRLGYPSFRCGRPATTEEVTLLSSKGCRRIRASHATGKEKAVAPDFVSQATAIGFCCCIKFAL